MFTRTRTIKGRQYVYAEWRWREGGKVRSKSKVLSRIGGFIGANLKHEGTAGDLTEAQLKQHCEVVARNQAEKEAAQKAVYTMLGVQPGPSNPSPVDKESPAVVTAGPEATQPPSSEE